MRAGRARVAAAIGRLAEAWRDHGGADRGFLGFVREAAAVSGAPDALMALPHLEGLVGRP